MDQDSGSSGVWEERTGNSSLLCRLVFKKDCNVDIAMLGGRYLKSNNPGESTPFTGSSRQ